MNIAKDCLDVGLYTDRYDDLRAFYVDRLGLPYEELLKAGRGIHQHRVGLHGSVLKLNDSRDTLADAPTPFVRLDIHADHVIVGDLGNANLHVAAGRQGHGDHRVRIEGGPRRDRLGADRDRHHLTES